MYKKNCFWNMFWKEVLTHKRYFCRICQQILEKKIFKKTWLAGCILWNSKYISNNSSSPLEIKKYYITLHWDFFGEPISPVTGLALFHIISSYIYFKFLRNAIQKTGSRKSTLSIHIKIYLWSFVDYHHLQKHFYNRNIILDYCFTCKNNIRGYFIWKCLL